MKKAIMSFYALLLMVSVTEMSGQNPLLNNSSKIKKLSAQQFVEQRNQFQSEILGEDYITLVSFENLPSQEEISQLNNTGIQLLNYHSKNTYLAKISTLSKFSQFEKSGIKTIQKLAVEEKLSPYIKNNQFPHWAVKSPGTVDVAIILTDPLAVYQAKLINDFNFSLQENLNDGKILIGRIPQDELVTIASSPMVAHIDAIEPPVEILNQENRAVQRVNVLQSSIVGERNLTGEGVAVGIGDGGELGNHIDFEGRVINYANGSYSSFGAHGDHVAGIVGGGGNKNPIHRGMAPECDLIIQKTTSIISNSASYYNDHGMVMTNNSYGVGYDCETNGTYNYSSRALDEQSRNMPELLHVFAAGNSGYSICGNYPAGYKSVLRYYQSAKNVLTVGNATADRVLNNGSSKGPVSDGRLKPEICGVGTNVLSTGRNYNYYNGTGTSMASPSVVGTMTLLNQRYQQLNGSKPKGALMKAIVCNTADDLGNAGPDYAYGYGLINGRRAVECIENNSFDSGSISDGESLTFNINVPNGQDEIKVMLYWHDVEAEAYAVKALINDLDLKITSPDGTEYLPWVLNHDTLNVTDPAIRKIDTLNNIEQVTLNNPTAGTYTITISGSSVPTGPQEFFITYDFVSPELVLTYPYGEERFIPGTTQVLQWDAETNNSNDFTIEYSINGGNNWSVIASNVSSGVRHYSWAVPNVTTENGLIKITKEGTTETDENILPFYILERPANLVATPVCEGYIDLTWDSIPEAQSYEIYKLSGSEMVAIGVVNTNTYSTGSLDLGKEYWYAVRAIATGGTRSERSVAIKVSPSSGGPCPWNFDMNLRDILVTQVGREFTSSALTNGELITLDVKNLGANEVESFEIQYEINGGALVSEMINENVASGDSLLTSFSNVADLSEEGMYQINAYLEITDDADFSNNEIVGEMVVVQLPNNPITLPYTEDFENITASTFTEKTMGLSGLEKWDFSPDTSGELNLVNEGSNKCLETNGFSNNTTTEGVTLTLNMTNYIDANDLKFSFDYKYAWPDVIGEGDKIYLRGSDTETWVEAKELTPLGSWQFSDEIDISSILANEGQSLSSSFQIHFSQGKNTGYALDNFSMNALNALPVELTSFTVTKENEDAVLKWTTASELNNERFEIEVALHPLPLTNENFKRIGTVLGNGTTTTNQLYTYHDETPQKSGLRYYRLKQINTDGSFEYSDIKAADFGERGEVDVFPNPFVNEIKIKNLPHDTNLHNIQVFNSTGVLVYERGNLQETEDLTLIFEEKLPMGVYFLRLITDHKTMTYPILKSEK